MTVSELVEFLQRSPGSLRMVVNGYEEVVTTTSRRSRPHGSGLASAPVRTSGRVRMGILRTPRNRPTSWNRFC